MVFYPDPELSDFFEYFNIEEVTYCSSIVEYHSKWYVVYSDGQWINKREFDTFEEASSFLSKELKRND